MGKRRCCGAVVWRINDRRRQCSACRRSWTVWPRRRGRPKLRVDDRLIQKVFVEHRTLTRLARDLGITRQALSYRFLRALERYLRRSKAPDPEAAERFALLIDGLRFRFKRRPWVLYLMAFKPPEASRATFIDPVLQEGQESREGWRRALRTIPSKNKAKIRALVCDNFAGSTTIAEENRWSMQLCQFHLTASMRRCLGRYHRFTVSFKSTREEAYQLVQRALSTSSDARLAAATTRLTELADQGQLPFKFTNIIREFVRRLPHYRAYRLQPQLRLPKTTSSIESKGRTIRDLMGRARSLRTPRSLNLWAKTYIRLRPTVVCRPANLSTD